MTRPLALIILDGWGCSRNSRGNAVLMARTPCFDRIWKDCPHTTLAAAGEAVGLPEGQMGNSEVGHLNIGAGRVVYQDITRIKKAIKDGSFYSNTILIDGMAKVKEKNSALHLFGLVSNGGVHSHLTHLYAIVEMAQQLGVKRLYLHAFLDGRDVPPASAEGYIRDVEAKFQEIGLGEIATVSGRYYAMDRDQRWDRVKRAYESIVCGEGETAFTALEAVEQSYKSEVTDEFVLPTVIVDEQKKPKGKVVSGDTVIFFNFRSDRARELTRAFTEEDFAGFPRKSHPDVHYICMTQYDVKIKAVVAFPPQELRNTLGEVLANNGLKQLRIAETEKYAHVTFFFNGGVEAPLSGEERVLIPSPKVSTYDLQPEMSACEVTEKVLAELAKDCYKVIILNYANPDMVGHTGILEAAVKAVETVDACLEQVIAAISVKGGVALVTADHGNAEQMFEEDGDRPHTAHTTNRVPFILVGEKYKDCRLQDKGSLADIAPTILDILKVDQPEEMKGNSLILR